MKKRIQIIVLLVLTLSACHKEKSSISTPLSKETLSVSEAVEWLRRQSDTSRNLEKYSSLFANAKSAHTSSGNRIIISVPGQTSFDGIKQGYRQLSVHRDDKTNQIEGKFLEIIPDAIYFQSSKKIDNNDFTGRIMVYDLNYKFQSGKLYTDGKQVGEARPSSNSEKNEWTRSNLDFEPKISSSGQAKVMKAQAIQHCVWVTTTYIDGEGIYNIHAERFCTSYIYDDGINFGGFNDPGINTGNSGGSSSGSSSSTPPPPSNLPQEEKNNVDPKKMMDCFGNIPDLKAFYQVKVIVVEPFPGTSFNLGPNSFGHVAISLTKINGDQSVTQTVGYYPTGTGLDKLHSAGVIKDNGDIEYNVSSTYTIDGEDFKKIIDYVSNPAKDYDFTEFNCAGFVYAAAKAGNLPIPDPMTQIGMGGPGGVGIARTPAGMGAALRDIKANDPNSKISTTESRAPASKGECN